MTMMNGKIGDVCGEKSSILFSSVNIQHSYQTKGLSLHAKVVSLLAGKFGLKGAGGGRDLTKVKIEFSDEKVSL